MPKKLTTGEWITKARGVHGDRYDYSRVDYKNAHVKVVIICPEHGPFEQNPASHLKGSGCAMCANRITHTIDKFINDSRAIHGDKYDYSQVDYKTNHTKVTIICPDHGPFDQTPASHKNGRGCSVCSGKKKKTKEEYVAQVKNVHGDQFGYDRLVYTSMRDNVIITCPTHGDFEQNAEAHLKGSGCPRCSDRAILTNDEFIERSIEVHGDRYDYSQVSYVNARVPVTIICPDHGPFVQKPSDHTSGCGCQKCGGYGPSKQETEVKEWLESYGVTVDHGRRDIIHPKELDLYLPDFNLAIEFTGLIWHSSRYNTNHKHLLEKHLLCEEQDIRLVTIFADEWMFEQEKVKTTLRHFIGKSDRGIYARKADIRETTWREVSPLLERNHLLGKGTPGNYIIGAYDGDVLIAAMVFGEPSDERGSSGVIEMKRFITDGRNHPGLGSRMFKHATRGQGYKEVIAFVDRRWFTGSFKAVSGFVVDGITEPTLYWTNGRVRKKRRFMTKKQLVEQFGSGKTKKAMLEELGWYQIYDCGKVRLKWVSE